LAYRGWFQLDDLEIANSSRVAAHLGLDTPTMDSQVWGGADCGLDPIPGHPGLFQTPASVSIIAPGLCTPPDGSRRVDAGILDVGQCWSPSRLCGCGPRLVYDDTWTGLQAFLRDSLYRVELAPWYRIGIPESGEFAGVWVMEVKGLGPTPVTRTVNELVGDGAAAAPHRDGSRTVTFTALLVGCSNAGVTYGLEWLACRLRETRDRTDATLRYLHAHPQDSDADPADLVREVHGVVLTKAPDIDDEVASRGANTQSYLYRISWDMVVLRPGAYTPPAVIDVIWDEVTQTGIQWAHQAACPDPGSASELPVLFSTECSLTKIDVDYQAPPTCGGCMPLCAIDTYTYVLPLSDSLRCTQTAVTITITNLAGAPLTCQTYWRTTQSDNQFPMQVSGLRSGAALVCDAVNAAFYGVVAGRKHLTRGIVSTPDGAPWMPPIIDRTLSWELVVIAPVGSMFDVALSLADREA
jgi:hypothetical protein